MILTLAPDIALRLSEVRQDVVVRPTLVAEVVPLVEIGSVATDVDHAIHPARPAQHLTARIIEAAAIQRRDWLGIVAPVERVDRKILDQCRKGTWC